jgi:Skp family chaperone for outer membrane proteins
MKDKSIVLAVLVSVIALAVVGYEHISLKKNTQNIQKITVEQENILLELGKLNAGMGGLKADSNASKLDVKNYTRKMMEPAGKQAGEEPKIAVVSVRKIFQGCRRSVNYREEAIAERDRIMAELDKLSKEIEAERAGLKTLKEDSSDYMNRTKELFEKQAKYQAQQEFYKQQMELKDQLWTKQLYQDILRAAGEVAKEKGLDLVLREDDIDFSETDISELGLSMRTQKLLYSGGCSDITDEVIAQLDAEK